MYSFNLNGPLLPGDSIEVTGTLYEFSGLLELSPVASITLISSGNPVPAAQILSPSQLNESNEGELIRINNALFQNGGAVFSANTSYGFAASGETGTVYVRTGAEFVGQTVPIPEVDFIGICSEYNGQYQVLVRTYGDFIFPEGIIITELPMVNSFSQNTATIQWKTNVPGTTSIMLGLTPGFELGLSSAPLIDSLHTFTLTNLLPGQIYYYIAISAADGNVASSSTQLFGTISNSSGNIQAYFNTAPDTMGDSEAANHFLHQAIDDTLIAYINRAEETLDLTIYDFNNEGISNVSEAINNAHNRGVRVRFISDGSLAQSNTGDDALLPEIPKLYSPTGGVYGIQHNKFVIIDAQHSDPLKPIVWTGAVNWTDRQINRDPNDAIIVQDQTLARSYTLEFEEMWGSHGALPDSSQSKFGPMKTDNTVHRFVIGGRAVESYFSPSDNVNANLIAQLRACTDSIHFATMLITRYEISDTLALLHNLGLEIRGIVNHDSSTLVYSDLLAFMGESLQQLADSNRILHYKFFVGDVNVSDGDPKVWTGSHNWSGNANTRNDENSLVVHDADVARWYYRAYRGLLLAPDTATHVVEHYTSPFEVYPNPAIAGSKLHFEASFEHPITRAGLFDAHGRRVCDAICNAQAKEIQLPSTLSSGIYLLVIHDGMRAYTTRILVP